MASILNLTQHQASQEQLDAGVENLPAETLPRLKELLTFDDPPTYKEMIDRAWAIIDILPKGHAHRNNNAPAKHNRSMAMIGGAPFFIPVLADRLLKVGITPVYAFTKRLVTEDGNGKKTSVFQHVDFVEHPWQIH